MRAEDETGYRKAAFLAVVSVLCMAVLAGTATYAWFINNKKVSTGTASGKSGTADLNLLLGPDEGSMISTRTGEAAILQLNEADMEKLLPVSTADLTTFLYASGFDAEGRANKFSKDEDETKFYHGQLCLRMDGENIREGTRFRLYLDRSQDSGGEIGEAMDGYLLNAARIGLRSEEGEVRILSFPEESKGTVINNTVVGGVEIGSGNVLDDSGNAVPDPAEELSAYALDSSGTYMELPEKYLALLNVNQTYTFDIFFYLEGCDEDCAGDLSSNSCDFHLAFYAIAEE